MKIYMILFLFLMTTCKEQVAKANDEPIIEQKPIILDNVITKDSIAKSKIMTQDSIKIVVDSLLLKKERAIQKFGKPIKEETLLLEELYGEFRGSIYNKYNEEERQSKTIYIEEITWEKDKDNYITIWYEKEKTVLTPKASLIWNKLLEF